MDNAYAPGDIVKLELAINRADYWKGKNPGSNSRKLGKGEPGELTCVVLTVNNDNATMTVTYVATFAGHEQLPEGLDQTMFYPFDPAPQAGFPHLLPKMANGKAGWASLRQTYTVKQSDVIQKQNWTLPEGTVDIILKAMKG
ncbi:SubName: Full=Uncharacterized protein {ECO:0000313/EMBL:CCA69723.1} [Serendipita indica DSM 11827]|nr:SubName: Full=Uncharacterized protein {ECO:0000313/EMBL:CCA69723.1} [Serendipita indica DSM 11827]